MLEGFSDGVQAVIVGGILTLAGTFITAAVSLIGKWVDARSAERVARINAEAKEPGKGSGLILTGYQSAPPVTPVQTARGFRLDPLWIPIVLVAGIFLTGIFYLAVGHEGQQKVKEILYNSPEFHMNMGDQYAEMGDYSKAEPEYRQALEDDGSDALKHDKLAVALAEQGKLDEALKESMTAVSMDSTVGQYHYNKGVTFNLMGAKEHNAGAYKEAKPYYESAENAFRTAIDLEPKVADYHFHLADTLCCLNRFEDAEKEYLTAINLDPNNSVYYAEYALCFCLKGQFTESLKQAKKAVELDKAYANAYYLMGASLNELHNLDDAETALRSAIQLEPDTARYYNELGIVLDRMGRFREAVKQFETALSFYEDGDYIRLSMVHYNIVFSLVALNRYDEALFHIEQAIELLPNDPLNHYERYALLTYFNRPEEAREEYETAYELAGLPLPEEA